MKLNDKNVLRQLRVDIDTALIPICEKFGLKKLSAGNIRYEADGLSAKIQLNAEVYLDAGQPTREEKEFLDMAEFMGISKDALHKEVNLNGRPVEILGLNLRRRRYPVVVREVSTNKTYFTTTDVVTRKFPVTPVGNLQKEVKHA